MTRRPLVLLTLAGHSGLCVDVPHASRDNGVQVALWNCTEAANQRWRFNTGGELSDKSPP
jgi:hypothetical protein